MELIFANSEHFVFNRQSQVRCNAPSAKVKARRCSENCKRNHPMDRIRPDPRLIQRVPRVCSFIRKRRSSLFTRSVFIVTPRNFYTLEVILPERWFSNGAPGGEHNAAAFYPFSSGPTVRTWR